MVLQFRVQPATSTPARARLVFIHGFTQTGRSWETIAEQFPDHDAVLVDAPGHGDSAEVQADLWQGATAIAKAAGPGVYVGYSMGGRFALHVALGHPQVVERLVLISTTAGIDDADERARRRDSDDQLAAELEHDGVELFVDRWLTSPLFAHLSREAAGIEDRRRNTVAGLASSLRLAGTGTQEPLWDLVEGLNMPVLVVAGEYDDKFVAAGKRLADSIGPNAQLAVLAGAGHTVHLEQPAAFVDTLRHWLDE